MAKYTNLTGQCILVSGLKARLRVMGYISPKMERTTKAISSKIELKDRAISSQEHTTTKDISRTTNIMG